MGVLRARGTPCEDGLNAMEQDRDLEAKGGSEDPNEPVAALAEPSLRAAALALGVGIVWVVFAYWRRRRPSDAW